LTESEKSLKEQLEQFMAENSDLSFKLCEALALQKKLQDEMSRTQTTHEEEVKLRLEFENKLNSLHSLQRDL